MSVVLHADSSRAMPCEQVVHFPKLPFQFDEFAKQQLYSGSSKLYLHYLMRELELPDLSYTYFQNLSLSSGAVYGFRAYRALLYAF